ncbi:MAG TPA: hypothetical protein VFQ68_41915 [Streptosporangiaceae bacterium]|nr:hypothetical protein [Streptosporangiaceae bacterium]
MSARAAAAPVNSRSRGPNVSASACRAIRRAVTPSQVSMAR